MTAALEYGGRLMCDMAYGRMEKVAEAARVTNAPCFPFHPFQLNSVLSNKFCFCDRNEVNTKEEEEGWLTNMWFASPAID